MTHNPEASVDVAGPQVGHEQTRAAEHVQGQKAVMVVVAVEEAAFLGAARTMKPAIGKQNEQSARRISV
jgi:hypothetical protein